MQTAPPSTIRWTCLKSSDKEVFLTLVEFLEEESPPAQAFRIPPGSRSGAAARAAGAGRAPCLLLPVGRAGGISPSPRPLHGGDFLFLGGYFFGAWRRIEA